MKNVQVSTSSWHFRLMRKMDCEGRYADNICDYLWSLMWALIGATVLVTFGGVLAVMTLIIMTYGWYDLYLFFAVNGHQLGWGAGPLILLLTAVSLGLCWLWRWQRRTLPPVDALFISAAWESVHDKVCFRLERTK